VVLPESLHYKFPPDYGWLRAWWAAASVEELPRAAPPGCAA